MVSRVDSEAADDRQACLQRLRSCVCRLQDSGTSSGSPHNALHSLVIDDAIGASLSEPHLYEKYSERVYIYIYIYIYIIYIDRPF